MIPDYGVSEQDVLDRLPSNTRLSSTSADGVTSAKVTSWITSASAQLTVLLERAGVDPTDVATIGEPSREVAKNAITSFALARCLQLGQRPDDPRIAAAWQEWEDAKAILIKTPSTLGDVRPPSKAIHSTVSPSNRKLTFRDNKW